MAFDQFVHLPDDFPRPLSSNYERSFDALILANLFSTKKRSDVGIGLLQPCEYAVFCGVKVLRRSSSTSPRIQAVDMEQIIRMLAQIFLMFLAVVAMHGKLLG